MANLEKEFIEYNEQSAVVAEATVKLKKIEKDIINKYCPFKPGDQVVYNEWWRNNDKNYFGIVRFIYYHGYNEDAIDKRWKIHVIPTSKEFKPRISSFNAKDAELGYYRGDKIRLFKQ